MKKPTKRIPVILPMELYERVEQYRHTLPIKPSFSETTRSAFEVLLKHPPQ